MEYGGLIIIATLVIILSTVPHLVARRTAITQSREIDRFSPRMRIIKNPEPLTRNCTQSTTAILALRRVAVLESGDNMERAASKPQVRVDRRANHNVREIAKLRARRAARISAEAAAGRRRMVISAVLALVTGIVAIVAALTPMSLAWTLVSGLALAIELGTSRLAAVRSEKAAQREAKMLAELRGGNQHDRVQGDGDAPADSHAQESQVVAREAIVETRVQVISEGAKTESVEPIEDEANAEEVSTDASASAGDQPIDTTAVDQTDDDAVLSEATASVERRTWSVASVPAPTYAMRGRIAGRMVHPDTDLRGIPKVEARVPARPSEVTLTSGTRSTDQVVASSVVALDLDAVLEARRAL